MSLNWIIQRSKRPDHLIVFVHGFTGGKKTFINKGGIHLFHLLDERVRLMVDCVEYSYYSRAMPDVLSNRLLSTVPWVSKWFHSKKNQDPATYADVLKTEVAGWR